MRDKYGTAGDPACYPGTDVLINKLGLRDGDRLEEAEAEFAAIAVEKIDLGSPPFDLAYLQGLHSQLFGDVYAWAGQVRTIDISKGQTRFCTASRIVPETGRILAPLATFEAIHFLNRPRLVSLVAELYGELNMVHPFRDGNGRAMRLFFEHAILIAGYGVSWLTVERDDWISACIAAVDCDASGAGG